MCLQEACCCTHTQMIVINSFFGITMNNGQQFPVATGRKRIGTFSSSNVKEKSCDTYKGWFSNELKANRLIAQNDCLISTRKELGTKFEDVLSSLLQGTKFNQTIYNIFMLFHILSENRFTWASCLSISESALVDAGCKFCVENSQFGG